MTSDEELVRWTTERIKSVHSWAIFYWTLHNWCALLSFAVAIAVPFGLAITVYAKEIDVRAWSIGLLVTSGFGLILQVLGSVMRFKERSIRGRRLSSRLEGALLRFREGVMTKAEFLQHVDAFLEEDYQEEGP